MYTSLQKIDMVVEGKDGERFAVQTDHRDANQILEEWDLSVFFAAVRARNARIGGGVDTVRMAFMEAPPAKMVRFLQACDVHTESGSGGELTPPAPDLAVELSTLQASLLALGNAAFASAGLPATVEGLRELEARLLKSTPRGHEEEEGEYWEGVGRLCGAATVVMLARHGGKLHADNEAAGTIPYRWEIEGSLNNLYGRAASYLDDDPEVSPSKIIDMVADARTADGPVMFNLRPPDWKGVGIALTLPLLENLDRVPDHGVPVLALVRDLPTSTQTLPKDSTPEQVAALRAEALANLRAAEVEIAEIAAGESPVLIVHGHYYAAERLLDPEFMRSLAARLGNAPILLAAAPIKGRLVVQSGLVSPDRIAAFTNLVRRQYDEAAPSARISAAVLLVQDGMPVGLSRLTESAPQSAPPKKKGFWARLFGGGDN